MRKPQPKAELVIDYAYLGSGTPIYIAALSTDAKEWIAREATKYGILQERGERGNDFVLLLHREYDAQEVGEYLKSYLVG